VSSGAKQCVFISDTGLGRIAKPVNAAFCCCLPGRFLAGVREPAERLRRKSPAAWRFRAVQALRRSQKLARAAHCATVQDGSCVEPRPQFVRRKAFQSDSGPACLSRKHRKPANVVKIGRGASPSPRWNHLKEGVFSIGKPKGRCRARGKYTRSAWGRGGSADRLGAEDSARNGARPRQRDVSTAPRAARGCHECHDCHKQEGRK
jgi:hypothetical protein